MPSRIPHHDLHPLARHLLHRIATLLLIPIAVFTSIPLKSQANSDVPNIVLILADDLGYGDLGCYGQKQIKTPRLDQMAAEGMRFSQFYAGATVCAPSRCVLMTGLHTGHCRVRGNGGAMSQTIVPDENPTVADFFQESGYTTGLVGKWGLGDEGLPGLPRRCGFDYFFGYLSQSHAHNYYPEFLWRNETKVPLDNEVQRVGGPLTGFATKRVDYSHDLFAEDALAWVEAQRDKRFFLYLSLTIPHANNQAGKKGMEVPDFGQYADRDWPEPQKGMAAMISRMDRDVGRLLDKLKELGIDDDTLVMFTSDNGPHREGGNDPDFFNSNGPLRGIKRDLYEGGIRVPMIARWPGQIAANSTSDHIGYFGDLFATCADLIGKQQPAGLDSISFAPTMLGRDEQQEQHDYLYWGFWEGGGRRAIRHGQWKAVRPKWYAPMELYDLGTDLGEAQDLAAEHPMLVEKFAALIDAAHVDNEYWKAPERKKKPTQR